MRSRHGLPAPAALLLALTACASTGSRAPNTVSLDELRLPSAAAAAAMAKPLQQNADVTGTFSENDAVLGDTTRFHVWRFDAVPGRRSTIRMASTQFTPYLVVASIVGDSLEVVGSQQGEDGPARVSFEPVDRGPFYVIANASHRDDRGEYALRAGAYQPPSLTLARVPRAEIRTLERANTGVASLGAEDRTLSDQSRYQLWRFNGSKGERLSLSMASSEFRPYLAYGRMVGDSLLVDGQAGARDGAQEAVLVIELERDGEHVVVANGTTPGDVGRYTLRLEPLAEQRITLAATAREKMRTLVLDVPQRGELAAGDAVLPDRTHYQLWQFEGRAGASVMVTMTSPDVDAYLYLGLLDGDVLRVLKANDDRGVGHDARVRVTLPRTGTYIVVANSLNAGELGTYRIVLEKNRGAIRLR